MIEVDNTIEIIKGDLEITNAFISYNDFEESTSLERLIYGGSSPYVGEVLSSGDGTLLAPYILQIQGEFNNKANAVIYFDFDNKNYPKEIYVLKSSDRSYASGEFKALYQPNEEILIKGTRYSKFIVSQVFCGENEFIETANFYNLRDEDSISFEDYAEIKIVKIDNNAKSATYTFYVPYSYKDAEIFCDYEVTWSEIQETIINDSPIVAFRDIDVPQNDLRIGFSSWTAPNSYIKISSIDKGIYLHINKNQIISNNIEFFDRENIKLPEYGVVSQRGNLQYLDYDNITLYYIDNNLANKGLRVITTLKNTLTSKSQLVSIKFTSEWQYDGYDKKVSVSFTDGLEEWQDLEVPSLNYDARYPETKTAKWYYDYLYSYTPTKNNMLSFEELDEETQEILNNTTITYPYLKSNNLFAQWNKLCTLCQLHIFNNMEGRTICKYNGGN